VRLLDQATVGRLLPIGACIEVMTSTLTALARGDAVLPLRTVIRIPDTTNAFAVMPAYVNDLGPLIGAKVITVYPGNHSTPLDAHQGAVLLFDSATGALAAVVDATAITTVRTAAVSAVATRLLARRDASRLAILGAGVQGQAHLFAMRAVRPIESVCIWSRDVSRAKRLAGIAERALGVGASVAAAGELAVRDADIVCTTTSATAPVLRGDWLAPGTHVNAIGACTPNARELDSAAVVRSRLYVDRRESALREPGDILAPLEAGEITAAHVVAELGDVLLDATAGRRSPQEITLFKSLGLAIEDLAAASFVYAEAQRTGDGVSVTLGGTRDEAH
jgi:alanine dehydrogenase